MSTNWLHNFFFGSDGPAIEELKNLQEIDIRKFKEVFSELKELRDSQVLDVEQFEKLFLVLEEKVGTTQFEFMQDHLNVLQEKAEILTDTVMNQEKMAMACCMMASIAAFAAITFISFCIYQGIKSEKTQKRNDFLGTEGEKFDNTLQDRPNTEFSMDDSNPPIDLEVHEQSNTLQAMHL